MGGARLVLKSGNFIEQQGGGSTITDEQETDNEDIPSIVSRRSISLWLMTVNLSNISGFWAWLLAVLIGTIYSTPKYNIEVIILLIGNSLLCSYITQSTSDGLFITQSGILRADWVILDNNENATLHVTMLYWQIKHFLEYFSRWTSVPCIVSGLWYSAPTTCF